MFNVGTVNAVYRKLYEFYTRKAHGSIAHKKEAGHYIPMVEWYDFTIPYI